VATAIVVQTINAVTIAATVANTVGGATVLGTVAATVRVANLGTLSNNTNQVINTETSGGSVAVISATVPSTLIAGGGSNTAYVNRSSSGSVLLTGGNSYIGNSGTASSTSTTLTGGQSLGDGRAYVDATVGTSNVTIGNNGLINVNTNSSSNANVVANSGTVVIAVSAATVASGSTVPAIVTIGGATAVGASGSRLIYIQNGGNALINANASDVVVLAGSNTGSETLIGGSGSTTVFGGRGMFTAGAGGGVMLTSTVNAVTTLKGGAGNDQLFAMAGGDLLIADGGNDILAGMGGFNAQGNTFRTGASLSSTTVLGGAGGANTIQLGAGSAIVYGQHGSVQATTSNANSYQLYAAGGSDTIGDFVVGVDVFKLSAGYAQGGTLGAPSVAATTVTGGNLVVTLSDQTRPTFVGVNQTTTTNIFS